MSRNRDLALGDKVELDVPTLRIYLAEMVEFADKYDKWSNDRSGDTHGKLLFRGQSIGINEAITDLLKALNLPEDWATQMDRLESEESRKGLE